MNPEQFSTPQKIINPTSSSALRFLNGNNSNNNMIIGTPNRTPNSITKKRSGGGSAFHLFPIMNKTSPLRFPKVINPFESALTERLHLPLICSPSLFQQPNTPKHSSIEFEWTIDEVSSLDPANVEPHETQFQATPDPDLEAKAQAAISSYFKEQQIVPSPVDCPLRRNQKIILTEETGNTPIVKSGRRIRDGVAQTILTFPSNLPPEIEKLLNNFSTYCDNQQQTPTVDCDISIDYEARDASLRRKLFETSSNISDGCENESIVDSLIKYECDDDDDDDDCDNDDTNSINELSSPKTPEVVTERLLCAHNSQSSLDKRSFGSLSPISKIDSPSVRNNNKNQNNKYNDDNLYNADENVDDNDHHDGDGDGDGDDDDDDINDKDENINDKIFICIKTNRRNVLPFSSTNYQDQIEKTIKTIPVDNNPQILVNNSLFRSTPFIEHEILLPSTPSPLLTAPNSSDMSIDISFNSGNCIINHLKKSSTSTTTKISTTKTSTNNVDSILKSKSFSDIDILNNSCNNNNHDDDGDDNNDDNDDDDDDDYMQVSQLSTKSTSSSNCSIQHPVTPIRKRRSARRKNLSQSFSLHLSNDDNDDDTNNVDDIKIINPTNNPDDANNADNNKENYNHVNSLSKLQIKKILYNCVAAAAAVTTNDKTEMIQRSLSSSSSSSLVGLYRTDSGFNEMSNGVHEDELKVINNFNTKQDDNNMMMMMMMMANKESDYLPDITMNESINVCNEDVSMICCSTPSTKGRKEFLF